MLLLPAVVQSGNPIGRCDEVEMPEATMDARMDGRMDGWMHWNEVEEMGYRDAYLHVNGESGLGGRARSTIHPFPTRMLRGTILAPFQGMLSS